MNILCIFNGIRVERDPEGKWICKDFAMVGPTGCMKDRIIQDLWSKPIEKAYQARLAGKASDIQIVNEKVSSVKLDNKSKDKEKLEKIKDIVKKTKKMKKNSLSGGFNPFAKD